MVNVALIIIYLMIAMGLGVVLAKHGEWKDEKYNFWLSLIVVIINLVLIWWALGWRFI